MKYKNFILFAAAVLFMCGAAKAEINMDQDALWIKISPKQSQDVTYIQADENGNAVAYYTVGNEATTRMGKIKKDIVSNFISQSERSGVFSDTTKVDSRQLFYKTSAIEINVLHKGELKSGTVANDQLSRTMNLALKELRTAVGKLSINRNVYRFIIVSQIPENINKLDSSGRVAAKSEYQHIETSDIETVPQLDEAITFPNKLLTFKRSKDFKTLQSFLEKYSLPNEDYKPFAFATSRGNFEGTIFIPNDVRTDIVKKENPNLAGELDLSTKKRRRSIR